MNGTELFYFFSIQRLTDLTVRKNLLTESQSNTLKHSTMMFCQHVK